MPEISTMPGDSSQIEFHKVICCDNHSFLLDKKFNFYSWGDNYKGQLGLGNNKYFQSITYNETLSNKSIREFDGKGIYNLALLEDGKVFLWPFEKSSDKFIFKPVELPLPLNVVINIISCGNNFVMYINF